MNIFEYLGLDENHRKLSNKVTQLVKHWDEVVEKHKKDKTFAVQIKKDGVCSLVVVVEGMAKIFSRTGKAFTNTEVITDRIEALNLRNGVYMGEMLLPKATASLEEVSGMVNPNRTKPLKPTDAARINGLEMHFFDYVSIESFIEGASQSPFTMRHRNLRDRIGDDTHYIKVLPYHTSKSETDIEWCLNCAIQDGEEGIVIRDKEADWEAGHKGWRVMKMVRGVDYDLKCVGYEEGTGKYQGKVANLVFEWKDGETIKCMLGKGWTHVDARDMFLAINQTKETTCIVDEANPIGKIFQVYALEESSKGKLRLPKVGELRHDKEEADV